MSIHIQPIVFTVRGYDDSIDTSVPLYNLRNIPHKFTCTIQIIDTMAHITGFTGTMNLKDRKLLSKILFKEYNISEASWRRGDKLVTIKN